MGVPKIQKVGHVTPSQPVNRGRRWLHISSPRPRFVYSLYNFHGATMTIKGSSLQVSIPIVKAFLTQNFCPVQKFTPNCCFLFLGEWDRNIKFCFETRKKHILRETTSFDVLTVKIGAGVLAVGWRKNQTSRSAIADKPRRGVGKLWQKCKWEKHASNIAVLYGAEYISKCWNV